MTYDTPSLQDAQVLLSLVRLKGIRNQKALELFASSKDGQDQMAPWDLFLFLAEEWAGSSSTHELTWQQVDRQLQRTCEAGIEVIPFPSPDYPDRLRQIDDPPVVLFAKGNIKALCEPASVAIVGTREPTSLGERAAERAGWLAAEAGVMVVSGLALGCDTKAHQGCADAGGIGIAVLANALNRVYPAENSDLAYHLLDQGGCLISENPVGAKLSRWAFAYRDRLQSGLADRVLVIETDVKGGTMHTVKYSRQQRRPLGCIDHPQEFLSAPKTRGNQMLIQNGTAAAISDSESLSSFIVGTPFPADPHAQDREAREGFLPLEEKFDAVTNVQAGSELAAGSLSEGDGVDGNPASGAAAPPEGEQLPMALGGSQC
jgi:DNA processing protein